MATISKMALSLKERKKGNLFSLLLLLTFVSCSQVRIHSASSRYITPEAAGKTLSGELEVQQLVGTQGTISLESNQIDNPMKLTNTVSKVGTGINLGILERIDFIGYSRTEGAPLYGVKVQLIGDPRNSAKKGNFSLALTAGMGSADSKFSDAAILSSSNTEANVEQSITDVSVIAGIRTDNDVLIYTSVQRTTHKVDLNITSNEASLNGKLINLESEILGASLGIVRYFENVNIKFEASAQQTNWTNNKQTTYGYLGVAIGRHW